MIRLDTSRWRGIGGGKGGGKMDGLKISIITDQILRQKKKGATGRKSLPVGNESTTDHRLYTK